MTKRNTRQAERPQRGCDVCGLVDDAPRHVHGQAPGEGVTPADIAAQMIANAPAKYVDAVTAHTQDSSTVMRHLDCCAQAGCPDGSCDTVVAESGGLTGDKLLAYLTGQ